MLWGDNCGASNCFPLGVHPKNIEVIQNNSWACTSWSLFFSHAFTENPTIFIFFIYYMCLRLSGCTWFNPLSCKLFVFPSLLEYSVFCLGCDSLVVLTNMSGCFRHLRRLAGHPNSNVSAESTTSCLHSSKAGRSAKKLRAWISLESPKFCWVGFHRPVHSSWTSYIGNSQAISRLSQWRQSNVENLAGI